MKFILLIASLAIFEIANAQGTWTQKADYGGIARNEAVGFVIGTNGYIGLGSSAGNTDFWCWNQATNVWTQIASPGSSGGGVCGFSIGNKGYIYFGGLMEYDVLSNNWTQKAWLPSTAQVGNQKAVGFSIGTKGYVGTGEDSFSPPFYKGFWEWDQSTDTWTQKTDFFGTARSVAVGFSIGSKGYIGTGWDGINPDKIKKDFWEWDQTSNIWTQKADFAGGIRYASVGFSIGTKGYIGTGSFKATNSQSYLSKDFWEWDQGTNTWSAKANFGGGLRWYAVGFSIGNKGYVGTGASDAPPYVQQDFWEFDPNGNGINEYNNKISISIFPNPFSSQTTLQTDNSFHNVTLTVDNCFGHTVAQIKNINGQTVVFSRDNLPSGLYFVRLTEDNKIIAVDKLVITDK